MDGNQLRESGWRTVRILLLGRNGQVGWELQRALAPLGHLIALGRQVEGDLCGDLESFDDLRQTVRIVRPNVIVNAAAHTAVDQAESEPELANRINTEAPALLAEEAARRDALLVHYSTDYVFDGHGSRPWREDASAAPINVYGTTKWNGEEAVRNSGARHLIFRTEWVYAARGKNFIRTILRLATERDTLQVIDDQVGAPTGAELVADTTAHAIRSTISKPELAGTYHLAASGETTWYGYARFIIEAARQYDWPVKVTDEAIVPVLTAAFAAPAQRPHNSRLAVDKLEGAFDLTMPEWRSGIRRTLIEIMTEASRKEVA